MNRAQRRAVLPAATGFAERDSVRLAYEVFGVDRAVGVSDAATPTVVLLPSWQIIASEFWKMQVGPLARHGRVVTYDGRGTGRSSRPTGAAAYTDAECAADIVAVLDATGTDRAVLVALSCANPWALLAAAEHPDRVAAIVAISPTCGFPIADARRDGHRFDVPVERAQGWAMYNKDFWLDGDFGEFRRFFFEQMCSEPHSTKQVEDFLGWSADTDPATLADATSGRLGLDGAGVLPSNPFACRSGARSLWCTAPMTGSARWQSVSDWPNSPVVRCLPSPVPVMGCRRGNRS